MQVNMLFRAESGLSQNLFCRLELSCGYLHKLHRTYIWHTLLMAFTTFAGAATAVRVRSGSKYSPAKACRPHDQSWRLWSGTVRAVEVESSDHPAICLFELQSFVMLSGCCLYAAS